MQGWRFPPKKFEYEQIAPHILTRSSWIGHCSFAYDLVTFMQPSVIVELGTHWGASFFSFCQAVKDNELPSACYAVDTWQGDGHTGSYKGNVYNEVKQIADSLYPEIATLLKMTFDEALQSFEDGSIQLLHIDGFHTYEAVKHDFVTWLPKLADNGIILFHDIAAYLNGFGVWKLWEELKAQYPSFEFRHSYGLGVLFPKGLSPSQMKLYEISRTNLFPNMYGDITKDPLLSLQMRSIRRKRKKYSSSKKRSVRRKRKKYSSSKKRSIRRKRKKYSSSKKRSIRKKSKKK